MSEVRILPLRPTIYYVGDYMEEVYTTVDMMKRDIHELEKQKYDLIKKNEALRMENENLKRQLFESNSSGQNFLTE